MSEEELTRKVEFIIEQQAQFAADIQIITSKHNQLTEALTTVVGMIGKLSNSQERLEAKVEALADAQKATDERLRETDDRLKETDERLNLFINVVERYISERQNGDKK